MFCRFNPAWKHNSLCVEGGEPVTHCDPWWACHVYLLLSLHSAGSDLLLCWFQLLDFEARSGEQVPLLLKMKRSQLALSKAVESGDTDLGNCVVPRHHLSVTLMTSHWWFPVVSVYTVVTYLKNEMNRGDFFMTLRNQPVALSLYRQVLFIIISSDWLVLW